VVAVDRHDQTVPVGCLRARLMPYVYIMTYNAGMCEVYVCTVLALPSPVQVNTRGSVTFVHTPAAAP